MKYHIHSYYNRYSRVKSMTPINRSAISSIKVNLPSENHIKCIWFMTHTHKKNYINTFELASEKEYYSVFSHFSLETWKNSKKKVMCINRRVTFPLNSPNLRFGTIFLIKSSGQRLFPAGGQTEKSSKTNKNKIRRLLTFTFVRPRIKVANPRVLNEWFLDSFKCYQYNPILRIF